MPHPSFCEGWDSTVVYSLGPFSDQEINPARRERMIPDPHRLQSPETPSARRVWNPTPTSQRARR